MLVVGDSAHDLATGRSAGAAGCIGVLSGTADRAGLAPLADVVLESVHELRVEEA
jgi:phosphoglycolate phosphatase